MYRKCNKCGRVLGHDEGRGLCPKCWSERGDEKEYKSFKEMESDRIKRALT